MNIVKIYELFPTHEKCIKYLEKVRWPDKPKCPYCESTYSTPMPKERRHHCNTCNTSFSVTVATIFHKTKLDLQKWFFAITLILNAKKGISARQLARDLNINKNTAWYMGMRIRKGMIEQRDLLSGFIEIEETHVGGKPRKRGPPSKRGRGTSRAPVIGIAKRGGDFLDQVQRKLDAKSLSKLVRENIDIKSSMVITDEFKGYIRLKTFTNNRVVDDQKHYIYGDIHTNTVESFWALLKRAIIGQFHKVSLRYLHAYIDEFCYRYNRRKQESCFDETLKQAIGGI